MKIKMIKLSRGAEKQLNFAMNGKIIKFKFGKVTDVKDEDVANELLKKWGICLKEVKKLSKAEAKAELEAEAEEKAKLEAELEAQLEAEEKAELEAKKNQDIQI